MDQETKLKIFADIQQGLEPATIADKHDVGKAAVYRLRGEYNTAKAQGDLTKIMDVDKMLVMQTADQLDMNAEATKLVDNMNGLDNLSHELQLTALAMNAQVKSLLLSSEYPSEIATLADVLCKLQTAFVNKQQMQVNVQNNQYNSGDSSVRYGQFLSDLPGGGNA